ncbi:MAG: HEAT repeat domain-containing protein, partial [Planctomycetota bacterium]
AESELALWLTQPQQMGVPPTGIEVLETKRWMWPSYNDPIDVHLIRFEYNFGESQYSNVGIAGPVAFALSTDVADLPNDDIYAIYAGWHAEHDEIFAVPASQLNEAQHRIIEPYQTHLVRSGYEDLKVELLGFFLDETAAVFRAKRSDVECLVITDGLEVIEQPTAGRLRPMQPGDLFNLFKGRKMLRTFNP